MKYKEKIIMYGYVKKKSILVK